MRASAAILAAPVFTASSGVGEAAFGAVDDPAQVDTRIDFSDVPFVIFAPAPPLHEAIAYYPLPDGSVDYWGLWEPDAAWANAAGHIDAFAMHAWMIRYSSTDEDLRRLFAWLEAHDIPLSLEVEPLTWPGPDVCDHTEGFEGPYDLEVARHIRDLGGRVAYIALDEPYSHAHRLAGPGACRYPVEQVVDEVADFVRRFRAIHPGAQVGSIEPLWATPRITARDMEIWLDTWAERTGEPFAFLSIDTDWRRSDWPEAVRAIEAVADARGVPFGMLYFGHGSERDNDAWLRQLAEHAAKGHRRGRGSLRRPVHACSCRSPAGCVRGRLALPGHAWRDIRARRHHRRAGQVDRVGLRVGHLPR